MPIIGSREPQDSRMEVLSMEWIIGKLLKKLEDEKRKNQEEIVLWRETSQSLAVSIHQICGLCDDLIDVIYQIDNGGDRQHNLVANLPAKVESIRRCASYICAEANLPGSAGNPDIDPYSLNELRSLITGDNLNGGTTA